MVEAQAKKKFFTFTKVAYLVVAGLLFLATGLPGVVALGGVIAFIYGLNFLVKLTAKQDKYEDSGDTVPTTQDKIPFQEDPDGLTEDDTSPLSNSDFMEWGLPGSLWGQDD